MVNRKMLFGSVCSGIEAASVAWHPLGWETAWVSDIDEFPNAVLKTHYPGTENLGDMRGIVEQICLHRVDSPDVLVGGTPCQAFSVAGLRNSLKDSRGNLTLTYVEIANAIDRVRAEKGDQPCVTVWENVPGVLNTRDNAFGCFLGALAGEDCALEPAGKKWTNAGCVFGPERAIAWRVFNAQYFGLAQRRNRVFVIASARVGFDPAKILFEFDGVRRDTPPRLEAGQSFTHDVAPCLTASGRGVRGTGDVTGQDPVVACMSVRLDMAVVHGTQNPCTSDNTAFALGRNNGQENVIAFSYRDSGSDVGSPSPTLRAMNTVSSNVSGGGNVAVVIPIHDKATRHSGGGPTRSGNDGCSNGLGIGKPTDPCPTLDTASRHAVYIEQHVPRGEAPIETPMTYGQYIHVEESEYDTEVATMVRRLMPVECEALQGFPRDYTDIVYRGKSATDTPRYKAVGNSMPVPVMSWIGSRLDRVIGRERDK